MPRDVIAPPLDFGAGIDGRSEDGESMAPNLLGELRYVLSKLAGGRQLQARNEIAADMGRGR